MTKKRVKNIRIRTRLEPTKNQQKRRIFRLQQHCSQQKCIQTVTRVAAGALMAWRSSTICSTSSSYIEGSVSASVEASDHQEADKRIQKTQSNKKQHNSCEIFQREASSAAISAPAPLAWDQTNTCLWLVAQVRTQLGISSIQSQIQHKRPMGSFSR